MAPKKVQLQKKSSTVESTQVKNVQFKRKIPKKYIPAEKFYVVQSTPNDLVELTKIEKLAGSKKIIPAGRVHVVIKKCPMITLHHGQCFTSNDEVKSTKTERAPIQKKQMATKKEILKFNKGEVVLVRWKFFPHWPVIITEIKVKKFTVSAFTGT